MYTSPQVSNDGMGSTSLSFHVDVGMCTILITVPFWHHGYKTNLRLVEDYA